jgi:hypothetical protein
MSKQMDFQVSGPPDDLWHLISEMKQPLHVSVVDRIYGPGAEPGLKRVVIALRLPRPEVSWFDRNGKRSKEEAADLEASTYGTKAAA